MFGFYAHFQIFRKLDQIRLKRNKEADVHFKDKPPADNRNSKTLSQKCLNNCYQQLNIEILREERRSSQHTVLSPEVTNSTNIDKSENSDEQYSPSASSDVSQSAHKLLCAK